VEFRRGIYYGKEKVVELSLGKEVPDYDYIRKEK